MDSEANFEHQATEQLIDEMMSFLEDAEEDRKMQEFDEQKNPLSWAIKRIINVSPEPPGSNGSQSLGLQGNGGGSLGSFYGYRMHANQIEKDCRYKDPYMLEVNRLIFSSTMGHPPAGTPEYYQAAENYALFGKEFLDFPTDMKFPQPMDVGCFDGMTNTTLALTRHQPSPGFGMHIGKCMKQLTTSAPQQQIFVNQTNYCSHPVFQTQNVVQPLIYSNPFLLSLNALMKETQMNAALVQQQQFLSGGIHERLLYAQMLQQQIQTNQAALMNSCFASCGAGNSVKSKHDMVKIAPPPAGEASDISLKPDLDGGVLGENSTAGE